MDMLRLDTLFEWKGEIWGENLAVWTQVMPPLRQTKKKKKCFLEMVILLFFLQ